MLTWLRDSSKSGFLKYILLGLLFAAGAGLVLTGTRNSFRRGGAFATSIAKGDGFTLGIKEFDNAVRKNLARQRMGPKDAYNTGIIHMILRNEIRNKLLVQRAIEMGFIADDDLVTKQLSMIADSVLEEGMSKSEAIKQVLRQQGLSEDEFIASIRSQFSSTMLSQTIGSVGRATAAPEITGEQYAYDNETRNIRAFVLTNNSIDSVAAPTDEQLEKFYEARKADYAIPEKRSVTIATLNREMVKKNIEIDEDEIRQIYDEAPDFYVEPEKRKIYQAILSSKEEAQKVLEAFKKEGDLKKAVVKVTGREDAYTGESVFEKSGDDGGALKEVKDKIFAMENNGVMEPVETSLGWHVLVLDEITPERNIPYEEARETIKAELMEDLLADEMMETANMIDDTLASGESLGTVVNEMGLTTQSFASFDSSGLDSKGKNLFEHYGSDKQAILENIFSLEDGEISPVQRLADGSYIIIRIDEITPVSYEDFEKVREELAGKWLEEQKEQMNESRADDALVALEDGKDFQKTAEELGAEIKTSEGLKRNANVEPPLNAIILKKIFDTRVNEPFSADIEGGILIGMVDRVVIPDLKKDMEAGIFDASQYQGYEEKNDISNELLEQYINNLVEVKKIKINNRLLEQTYSGKDY